MQIVGQTITLHWHLTQANEVYQASNFDIEVQNPSGVTTYTENGDNWSQSFLAPTRDSDGLLTHTATLHDAGLYRFKLCIGSPSNRTEIGVIYVFAVAHDPHVSTKVTIND